MALCTLTTIGIDTSFGSLAWRLALLGTGLGIAFPCITATAVGSVPPHQAGMAAAGNNAFRQVGAALGPAILGALLTTEAVGALPAHLADQGLTGATGARITGAVDRDGLEAVAGMPLGADTGRALHALSLSFVDGLHLCLLVSAVLMLCGALVALVTLRPQPARPLRPGGGEHGPRHPGSRMTRHRAAGLRQRPATRPAAPAADGAAARPRAAAEGRDRGRGRTEPGPPSAPGHRRTCLRGPPSIRPHTMSAVSRHAVGTDPHPGHTPPQHARTAGRRVGRIRRIGEGRWRCPTPWT